MLDAFCGDVTEKAVPLLRKDLKHTKEGEGALYKLNELQDAMVEGHAVRGGF